jgi:hypothetical protein
MEASDLVKAGIADKRQNILKGFVNAEEVLKSEENNIEKAGHGTYGDNAQNRKLNRVGQEYGHAGKKEEGGQKKTKTEEQNDGEHKMTIEDHAKNTDSETLKKVVSNPKSDPALVAAAKRELTARGETHAHNEKDDEEKASEIKEIQLRNKIQKIIDEHLKNEHFSKEPLSISWDATGINVYRKGMFGLTKVGELFGSNDSTEELMKNSSIILEKLTKTSKGGKKSN